MLALYGSGSGTVLHHFSFNFLLVAFTVTKKPGNFGSVNRPKDLCWDRCENIDSFNVFVVEFSNGDGIKSFP